MLGLEHPLSGARYELEPDGTISVHHGEQSGSFDGQGRWLSGSLRSADPLLCVWLSTGTARSRHSVVKDSVPKDSVPKDSVPKDSVPNVRTNGSST